MPVPLKVLTPAQCRKVRLLASDVDDTMTRGGRLTAEVLGLLERLSGAGIETILVTGRSAGVGLALFDYLPGVSAVIAENGGVLIDGEGIRPFPAGEGASDGLRARLDACMTELQAALATAKPTVCCFSRLTDATFEVGSVPVAARPLVDAIAARHGLVTAASSIHLHLKLAAHTKGKALADWMRSRRPHIGPDEVVTVGDSATDAPLFEPARFPLSVGVANISHVLARLPIQPAYLTESPEAAGFAELVETLCERRAGR
jgi:hypothetical protein